MKPYVSTVMASPVGSLTLVASERGLAAILWENDRPGRVPLGGCIDDVNNATLREARRQLCEYFAGERRVFSLRLDFSGTAFQRRVWQALLTIPYGETRSYGHIARQIGQPAAVRAVGAANGRNPISIVAPCHRVIGSSGQLTGFAGGLAVKAQLLAFEGARIHEQSQMNLDHLGVRGDRKTPGSNLEQPRCGDAGYENFPVASQFQPIHGVKG